MNSSSVTAVDLQQSAKDHLWMHFTRMGGYQAADVPIIVRGDGCYLEDVNGKRYLDALAGLFSVNIGYSFGEEIGQAALEQMRELPFYTNWSYAHPRAIELAAEVASLAPGDLNRAFFCSGGSEAVESAWKLARQFYAARGGKAIEATGSGTRHDGQVAASSGGPHRTKAIARDTAYHGTTMGALSITGIPGLREPFEPLVPEVRHVSNTNRYHRPTEETEKEFTRFLLQELEQTIVSMGPETVCLVHMEPVQNAGGAFTPPEGYFKGVRELCDRYDILLSADEVITGFGRVGYWFGSERYDIRPDLVTCAKGLSSSYASIGAVVATDRVMEPFLEQTSMFSHGITFGGHPTMCAIALKNIEIMKREGIVEHVRESEDAFRATLSQLLDLPIVGDLRGTGFFYAIELVKDRDTREGFTEQECEQLIRGFLSNALFDAGLVCRADDRGDPVDPDLAAARRGPGGVRRDRANPRRGADRGAAAHRPLGERLERFGGLGRGAVGSRRVRRGHRCAQAVAGVLEPRDVGSRGRSRDGIAGLDLHRRTAQPLVGERHRQRPAPGSVAHAEHRRIRERRADARRRGAHRNGRVRGGIGRGGGRGDDAVCLRGSVGPRREVVGRVVQDLRRRGTQRDRRPADERSRCRRGQGVRSDDELQAGGHGLEGEVDRLGLQLDVRAPVRSPRVRRGQSKLQVRRILVIRGVEGSVCHPVPGLDGVRMAVRRAVLQQQRPRER